MTEKIFAIGGMYRALALNCILLAGFATTAVAQVSPPTESLCWIKQATGDPAGTQLVLEVIVDEGARASGTEYVYSVEVVDSDRNLLDGWLEFDYYEYLAFAWFGGPPLVGIGTVVDGPYGWQLNPCPSTCFGSVFLEPGYAVDVYANTGINVALFGTTFCNWEGCFITASSAFPTECGPVPTREASWSSLKAKFD